MKSSRSDRILLWITVFTFGAMVSASAQDAVRLSLLDAGASDATGYYQPQKLALNAVRPPTLTIPPAGLHSPLYGVIPIGSPATAPGRVFHVIVDSADDGGEQIWVDANGDGNLTNDPAVSWESYEYKPGLFQSYGPARIELGPVAHPVGVTLGVYRFDPRDPDRTAYAKTLFYFADYGRTGSVKLGTASYKVMVYDELAKGDFGGQGVRLLIDLNGDGAFTPQREITDLGKPFNIGGTTWEIRDIAPLGESFRVVKSARTVAEMTAPPDLRLGAKTPAFSAADIDGRTVTFPGDFKGRIVMLDFWATWCGPCMQEVPVLAAVFTKYKDKGFDVLGISLDSGDQMARLRSVMKEKGMVWRQICDGKEWDAGIAQQYMVDSIPRAFLVDGDTGQILAAGVALRGSSLQETVTLALRTKGKL
jgi:thiol-disulfide isomerase/thioredoxin